MYQLLFLDKIPPYAVLFEAVEIAKAKYNQKTANLVNAILRNYLRQQKKFDFLEIELDILDKVSLKYSHPKWMLQRWIEYWGIDEVRLLCEANNARPRLAIRLNKSRADMDNFFKILDENGINYERHPDFEEFVWIDNFQEFRKLDFINKGWVSVQDVSTGIPVRVLDPQPGELILDMCAAPGGKTAYIAEKLLDRGGVLALDRHFSRIRMTKENVERLGFSNVFFTAADSVQLSTTKTFDRILLDAPCSGLGVLSKRSDLKWKRTEQDITNLKELQLNLLESAAQAVKLNGIIVYSTCTIEPEENEQVIETFLKRRPGFELEELGGYVPEKYLSNRRYVRTFPHKHKMDGSFVARLRKTSL